MYVYKAIVTKVYDADTITIDIDLGFYTWMKNQKIRLYGINAFEVRGSEKEKGKIARDEVRRLILGKEVIIHTHKDKKGKYGRWLATVMHGGTNLNEWLVSNGHAVVANY